MIECQLSECVVLPRNNPTDDYDEKKVRACAVNIVNKSVHLYARRCDLHLTKFIRYTGGTSIPEGFGTYYLTPTGKEIWTAKPFLNKTQIKKVGILQDTQKMDHPAMAESYV